MAKAHRSVVCDSGEDMATGFGYRASSSDNSWRCRHWASSHRPGSLAARDLRFATNSTYLLQSQGSESSLKVLEEINSKDSVLDKMSF